MQSLAAPRRLSLRPRALPRVDGGALSVWVLAGGLVLYLGIDGGGYDIAVHSQVAIIVWWLVLVGAAWGLLPASRPGRAGWAALALFGGFVGWTALATTWSLSTERSLEALSLVAGYLGVLVLGLCLHRDRDRAVRHTIGAVASAIVAIACVALASRLRPDLFPAARQTYAFLTGTNGRLDWPLNYWNALADLVALGLPLLLAIATSARALRVQAIAAAGVPLLALCGYLTFSRGGAIADAVAVLAFFALAPNRIPKLATGLVAGAGGAVLIAGAVHRSAIERGLTGATAQHQGATLVVAIVLVCAGVALAQTGIGLAARHGTPPRWLVITPERARWLLLAAIVAAVIAAVVAGAPGRLSHAWRDFKNSNVAALSNDSLARFGTISGNGRYDYWTAALDATSGHLLGGSGPGTYQLLWLPRAPYFSYVQNAHSLYIETLAEDGLVGLSLLAGFFLVVIGAAVRLVRRLAYEQRARAAGAAAALIAFCVAAASDWIWQVPVLPVAFILLATAVLLPDSRSTTATVPIALRLGLVATGIAALVAIAVPLATATALRSSQAAAAAGDSARALTDARQAARLEPGAASPQMQLALVLEMQGHARQALAPAIRATRDEPQNWSTWVIASRIEAETGHPGASLADYRRARSLNPHSPLFAG